MLASSSVDNNVYIWNAKKFPGTINITILLHFPMPDNVTCQGKSAPTQ